MESIRIENLRCLTDTKAIELKPFTLLVGANSSGKSSFLRVFPLLRQSVETRTLSGLLLNEGDANFGFFSDAIHKDASPQEMRLEFQFVITPGLHQGGYMNRFLISPMAVKCRLTYSKRSKDPRYPYLSAVRLLCGESQPDEIHVEADEEGRISKFHVNEFKANGEKAQLRLRVGRGIVPSLLRAIDASDGTDIPIPEEATQRGLFEKELLDQTRDSFHGKTAQETKLAFLGEIQIGTPEEMLKSIKSKVVLEQWRKSVQGWTKESLKFRNLRNLLLAKATGELLSSLNQYVSHLARSVHYFAPVRARVERDYTSRDVPVGSVDPQGLNVAMVLGSLPPSILSKFREWMRTHFNFEVYPKTVSDGARVALWMKECSSGTEFNLADMGFGFSQMLPFLVQIWSLTEYESMRPQRYRRSGSELYNPSDWAIPRSFLIVVEQPELHLHPALQSRLADLFVATAKLSKERKIPVRFVLETHSPTIIDRIGQLIERKEVSETDVQILLFERGVNGNNANTATIRHSDYDSDGILKDWPFGFLSPPPDPIPTPLDPNPPVAA